eukprot:6203166-Pleurochrysis_carterae.AAC.2
MATQLTGHTKVDRFRCCGRQSTSHLVVYELVYCYGVQPVYSAHQEQYGYAEHVILYTIDHS